MKRQLMLVSKLLDSERRLTDLEQMAILGTLKLEGDWEVKRVIKEIRRRKRKAIGNAVLFGLAGTGLGVIGAVILIQ